MRSEKIKFPNSRGESLAGEIEWPAGRPEAWALFAHCFTCTRNIRAARSISRALARRGIAVLRFDFTGLGESEGEFADTNFTTNVTDLVAAAGWLEREHGAAPALMVGHSLGGAAVLQAAGEIEACKAVATIGAPAEPSHLARMLKSSREDIERDGEATVELAGRAFKIRKQFLDDLESSSAIEGIARLKRALMVMHAPLDDTVSIDNAAEIFMAARHPKSFISLDRADHLLSREQDARYAGAMLAAWAAPYIGLEESQPGVRAAEGEVIARTESGSFFTEMAAGGHTLVADEPADVGGSNRGPTPYGLLSAALAACTTMTLQMYARHKKIALDAAVVRVRHEKIHADDCASCETKEGKVDRFERVVELEGELDDATRKRMLEIAERCPVHRTLHAEVVVETRLKGSQT